MAERRITFTDDRRKTWLQLIESGLTRTEANLRVGVSDKTIAKWLRVGRQADEGNQFEFAQAFDAIKKQPPKPNAAQLVNQERAGGLSVTELVALLEQEALNGNVPALKYLLERPWERKNDQEEAQPVEETVFDQLAALRERKAGT